MAMDRTRLALGTPAQWRELWASLASSRDPARYAVLTLLALEHGQDVSGAAWTAQALADGGYSLEQAREAMTRGREVQP